MAILIQVNGNTSGEGFLIAPDGTRTFPVPVGLKTDDGSTVAATLQIAAGGASVVFSSASVTISPVETFIDIHATSASTSRNDTVLQVLVSGTPQASFNLTAISNVQVWFKGRFQARFATDSDFYNHPRGTSSGWQFALDGEPDFVPADSVADSITKPVGRVMRFNNPVPLRSHVAPIGVSVNSIRATVGGVDQDFFAGDPIIGQQVDLGPNSYFAGNSPRNPADPLPAEQYGAAFEPIALFEFHISNVFSGTSLNATDRPIANGLPPLTPAEKTAYGVVTLTNFNTARKAQLVADFTALSPADQAASIGQNLAIRVRHLGGDPAVPGGPLTGTLGAGWNRKEEYTGLINKDVTFQPSNSVVLEYLAGYNSFIFYGKFFNFHSDEQCGQVHGNVVADTSAGVTPLQLGVYNIQSREASPFNALTIPQMTTAAIDAALGGAPVSEKVVVTVSPDFDRLVVSKAVIANPADPPAMWTITSRGESLVGRFLPEASVFPRDLFYQVLQPSDQASALGACEGTAFTPAPTVGFARLFADGATWKLLLHAGTNGADGVTYKGEWSGSTVTIPTGCVVPDVELLTPTIDFGNVEQGMTMFRQIVLLNRSASAVDITLPALAAPFGAPGAMTVTIPPGDVRTIMVSFTAGAPGAVPPTVVGLLANPPVAATLNVTLTGTSVAVATVDAVLVLDRSGSMAEPGLNQPGRIISKAQLRNEAAQAFVDLLRDNDRIGMVRFNQDAQEHMSLEVAGPAVTGTGRVNATTALASADLNPAGATSVGDGMTVGNTMLTAPSTADRHALVVLTDGKENSAVFISTVTLGMNVKAYAVGFGLPQEVDVAKLSAVTGNTGGYLLITGALDTENEFRLHKYFAQILAGIYGDSIVVDPRGTISPGDIQRIPFYITEADSTFDVVMFTRFPILRFSLEAPDGTRIDPGNVNTFAGMFVNGRACRYYRMQLPVFANNPLRALGKWHIVVDYPGTRTYFGAFAKRVDVRPNLRDDLKGERLLTLATQPDFRRGYDVLVRARSTIQMEARIEQRSFGPGVDRVVVGFVRAFGQPLSENLRLFAQITRPDGVTSVLPMRHQGNGRFEALLDDSKMLGHYNIVVRATGQTPANFPLQREQTLSGVVLDPAAEAQVDPELEEIKDLLESQQTTLRELLAQSNNFFTRPPEQAPRPVELHGKWLLWILILLILILLLLGIGLLTK